MKYNMYYVDTNIFLYRTDASSIYFEECKEFLDDAIKGLHHITTSVETIQEVTHVCRRLGKNALGIHISEFIIELCEDLIDVDNVVIKKYLMYAEKYPKVDSRDLVHLAACSYNGIRPVVTFDNDFKAFKEVKVLLPHEV